MCICVTFNTDVSLPNGRHTVIMTPQMLILRKLQKWVFSRVEKTNSTCCQLQKEPKSCAAVESQHRNGNEGEREVKLVENVKICKITLFQDVSKSLKSVYTLLRNFIHTEIYNRNGYVQQSTHKNIFKHFL